MHCLWELLVPWALKRLLFLYDQAGCTSTAADSAAVIESASWCMWLCLWWLFHWGCSIKCLWWLFHWGCSIKWQTNQFLLLLQFLSVFRCLLGGIMVCENVHLFWADINSRESVHICIGCSNSLTVWLVSVNNFHHIILYRCYTSLKSV